MKRAAFVLVFLSAVVTLGACTGTTTSVGIPADAPWNNFITALGSPYDDLTVVTVGSDITATIDNLGQAAVCTSDQGGFYAVCANPGCTPPGPAAECADQAQVGLTNVGFAGQLPFAYGLSVDLNRPAFTAGGVQIQSETAGTLGAIAVTIDGGTTLNIGAGFSNGLIPGPSVGDVGPAIPTELADDFAILGFSPEWEDFGDGWVCIDGTTTSCDPSGNDPLEGLAALCDQDAILFRTNAGTGPVTVLCGEVTVNINIGTAFASVGECISTLKAQWCSGLKGKTKAACNHAQIGVCHASFNVPSAHNN